MEKKLKILIWASVIYILILLSIAYCISHFKWSWWVLFWVFVIPLVFVVFGYLGIRMAQREPKKEKVDEIKEMDIDRIREIVRKWTLDNGYSVDIPKNIEIMNYTPNQEGDERVSLKKVRVEGYWENMFGGFDVLFMTVDQKTGRIDNIREYCANDINAESDYENRLKAAVPNPEKTQEIELREKNLFTGVERITRKKQPLEYLKKAHERKLAQKEEEEEGAEEE